MPDGSRSLTAGRPGGSRDAASLLRIVSARAPTLARARDVEQLPIDASVAPAIMGFHMFGHTLARAVIAPTYET